MLHEYITRQPLNVETCMKSCASFLPLSHQPYARASLTETRLEHSQFFLLTIILNRLFTY